ncbi:MAG: U32 family peptidase [Proteobacteria bacterium]|nr:U32 family peptidase [Pseudomonadota bacterium]
MNKLPELLAPAGDFEKLKFAIHYGAKAVYLGFSEFSLRGNTGGFTEEELKLAVDYCRSKSVKSYVTINIFAHNRDLTDIEKHLEFLSDVRPDGLIVSDPGVLRLVKKITPHLPVHISTQANITNYESALFYQDLGVKRLILSRELTLKELEEIRKKVSLELEIFIHGAICISYSGRCYLSSFLTYRSGNRGVCTHPCRWKYYLLEEKREGEFFPVFEDDKGAYIMNSKDLCLVEYLPELVNIGIDSFKIEGRMKGINYLSGVVHTYSKALNAILKNERYDTEKYLQELLSFSSRGYTTGLLLGEQKFYDYNFLDKSSRMETQIVGVVLKKISPTLAEVLVKADLKKGDRVYFLTPCYEDKPFDIYSMKKEGEVIDLARNEWHIEMEIPEYARELDIIRKKIT